MDISCLLTKFKNYDLRILAQYVDLLSTKTPSGEIFPPYIPLIGKNYEQFRLLIYATAQNLPHGSEIIEKYSQNYDKLVERLYYDWKDFSKKYPTDAFDFSKVAIAPYQEGVLPALAGVFLYTFHRALIKEFNEIQDHIAVSNYYKFSLRKNSKDFNPNKLNASNDYFQLNDNLVRVEIEILRPDVIITFNGRHVEVLKKGNYRVKTVNDPSWIKRGAGGLLRQHGTWGRETSNIEDKEFNNLVEYYANQLLGSYTKEKKSKNDAAKIYLKKYFKDWCARDGLG